MKYLKSFLIFLLINISAYNIVLSQEKDLEYLEYSRPFSKGFLIEFLFVNAEYRVAASAFEVFLLNNENVVIDSLNIQEQMTKTNPLQFIKKVGHNLCSVSTMKELLLVEISERRLIIKEKLELSNSFRKNHRQLSHYYMMPMGILGVKYSSNKKNDKSLIYFFDKNDSTENLIWEGNSIVSNFKFNSYPITRLISINNNEIILNFPNCNKSVIYNVANHNKRVLSLPQLRKTDTFQFVCFDELSSKYFLIKKDLSGRESTVYNYSFKDKHEFSYLAKLDKNIVNIYGQKAHTVRLLEKDFAHYYTPLIKRSMVQKTVLENVEIDN